MRLIDADAISIKPIDASSLEFDAGILSVLHHIDKMPTIDPVKHGRWVEHAWEWHKCSVCGATAPSDEVVNEYLTPYCPYCGASMDMGDE